MPDEYLAKPITVGELRAVMADLPDEALVGTINSEDIGEETVIAVLAVGKSQLEFGGGHECLLLDTMGYGTSYTLAEDSGDVPDSGSSGFQQLIRFRSA